MIDRFFEKPILNSPYEKPSQHWELDPDGQPTQEIIPERCRADFINPIPKPKKRRKSATQPEMVFDEGKGLSTADQQYDPTSIINELRQHVDQWRNLPNPNQWGVTPETARLLEHWRHHDFSDIRPFFCQIEAIETVIWLTEVAPRTRAAKALIEHLANANKDANPELMRLALKLATGVGKTTVMAMLIAWQTINAVRSPQSKKFTRGFLIVTPGITIKDRLRVLQPNDPDTYYASRELVPTDMQDDVKRAKIVITNFHSFKLRERVEISKGTRALVNGRLGKKIETRESEGQMRGSAKTSRLSSEAAHRARALASINTSVATPPLILAESCGGAGHTRGSDLIPGFWTAMPRIPAVNSVCSWRPDRGTERSALTD